MDTMAQILDGKVCAQKVREKLKIQNKKLQQKGIQAKLAVIQVGEDSASKIYVRNKSKACQEIGIAFEEILLPDSISMKELLETIDTLNARPDIYGILLQSPIPKGMDIQQAFNHISPQKDVDGFHPINVGKLALGQKCFIPCTAYGIMQLLETYQIPIEGKQAVIIGRSNIVGKPLSQCLLQKHATVTICHSRTKHLKEITQKADILVSAVGKLNLVTADMVKEGAVVIDVGMNRKPDGKLAGDVDFEKVQSVASFITPVPGGVGPMTIAMLMHNVIQAASQV